MASDLNLFPKITIVIPVYNVKDYLRECLDAIVGQSYTNIEIIVVNDGSTDGSADICEEYVEIDNRIILINQPNSGLSKARNSAIDIASGDYITFVDSDDSIASCFVEKMVNAAIDTHCDIAVCQAYKIDENSRKLEEYTHVSADKIIVGSDKCMGEYLGQNYIGATAWGKLYKRGLFSKIRYPEGKYHEDIWTTCKLIGSAEIIAVLSDALYYYRMREGSITNVKFTSRHLDYVESKIECHHYVSKQFPHYYRYTAAGIICGANKILINMVKSGNIKDEYISYLQNVYHGYRKAIVYGRCSIKSKLMALFAMVNLRFLIRIMRVLI